MGKLTVEEWNALDPEEQDTRKDEKPDELREKGSEPTIEELKEQLKKTNEKITSMEESHRKEKKGIIEDLQRERDFRQQLEEKIRSKSKGEDEDPFEGRADDDIVTVGDLKKVTSKQQLAKDKERLADLKDRAAERMDRDEERLIRITEKPSELYPVPYDEALEAFKELTEKDKTLWDEVNREALRPNGKPAEKMYRIAITQHPKLANVAKKSEREKIIEQMESEGKIPKRLSGGGAGKGELDLSTMSDEDILKAAKESPDKVDKALGKKE